MDSIYFSLDNVAIKLRTNKYIINIQTIHLSPYLYYIDNHFHKGYEIHYVTGGRGTVRLRDSQLDVQEGMVYITGPDVEHEQISDPSHVLMEYCLGFEMLHTKHDKTCYDYDADYVLDKLGKVKFWSGAGSDACFSLWSKIASEANAQKIGCYSNISSCVLQLLIETARSVCGPIQIKTSLPAKLPEDRRSTLLDSYMLWAFADTTLEGLAEKLELSTKQTARLIKKQYGMTFEQRLTQTKLDMAVRLLTLTTMPIREIAKTVGYSSAQYFSRRFKEKYQYSPAEYRKRYQP